MGYRRVKRANGFCRKSINTIMIPTTGRIIETCLYVADVDRAAEWYRQIFGFPIIFQQEDRLRALQVTQDQVLLLFKEKASLKPTTMPGGVLPPHDGSGPMHIAFAMQTAEADQWEMHLAIHGSMHSQSALTLRSL
jgi:catechol 2,3-dioxygenase-like lactoylglutathione lyase family enzyme